MSWIEDVNYELNKLDASTKSLRKFGITIGIVFLLISFWLFYINFAFEIIVTIAAIGLFLVVSGSLFPMILKKIYHYWMGFAFVLGWFISRFLLTILFIFILTPISIIAKLFKKDFLNLSNKKKTTTYWKEKEYKFSDYEKMY